jgi:hypothetical protein
MLAIKAERVMQWVGAHSMVCHYAGQRITPGQSLWEFLVNRVALGQGFL